MVARLLLFSKYSDGSSLRNVPLVPTCMPQTWKVQLNLWLTSQRKSQQRSTSSTQIELYLKQMTKLKTFYKTQIARHWILRFSYVRHLEHTKVWTNVFTNKVQKVIEVSYRITETSCKLKQKKTSNQQMSNGIFSFGFSSSIRFDRQQMTKF